LTIRQGWVNKNTVLNDFAKTRGDMT